MDDRQSHSSARRNKQNYLRAKAAYNARDLDTCTAYYAPDHQIMSKPTPRGREHIRKFFQETFATWPDIRIVVENTLAEDDWVMGRSTTIATHSRPVMGVPATHKIIETTFWDLHRFNDEGLIIETWNLMDGLSIMHQLGLVPSR
ncbi:MAG TPA: ester cyclase [Vineibacter sp.]|nr:ester cyclase [Vineibacter sp.]